MTFVIAVNYGSRDEITRAVRKIMTDVENGKIAPEDMTEKVFASYLDTAGIPDPDLMIRTSGSFASLTTCYGSSRTQNST